MDRLLTWLSGGLAIAATTVVLAGCAGDGHRSSDGSKAEKDRAAELGMAPGCGPGFDVTPTDGKYNEVGTLARAAIGQPVTITLTIRVKRATMIHRLQLIVGTPGSTAGAGSGPEALADSMLRAHNQVAAVDIYHGPARQGQRFPATVTLDAPGRYPVEVLASSLSPGLCGGLAPHHDVQSAQPIGYLVAVSS